MSKSYVNWKGDAAFGQIEQALGDALVEIANRIEGEAKKVLKPSARVKTGRGKYVWVRGGGRGKRTGTLQRSIHAAEPNYQFSNDDVIPSTSTPERGNGSPRPRKSANRLILAVGTGMEYAMLMHLRYKYITIGYNKVQPKALSIVEKYIARYKA